jgi:predicted transposase/invertase (TIGR01784 family)
VAERTLISFDYAVKYLLRSKDDLVILSGFLSELMGRRIEVLDFLESGSNKADPDEKTNCVDLKAKLAGGELAVFEIQFSREYDLLGRVLFGVSKAITEQVKSGNRYNIKKVYSINIAYFNMNAKRDYLFYGKFGGFHGVHFEDETIPFAQAVEEKSDEMVEIHPEYYLILPKMFDENMRGKFDEWVYVLKTSKARDDFTAAGIKEAKVKLDLLKMSPADREAYEKYLDNISSLDCAMDTAKADGWKEGKADGIAEGRAEGRAEGMEAGRAEGLEAGKAEERTRLAVALHKKGVAIDIIAETTELSADEINEIISGKP